MKCSVIECDNHNLHCKGLCRAHYMRLFRYGDASFTPRKNKASIFIEEALSQTPNTECLFWPYSRGRSGYPSIRVEGKTVLVTRLICERKNGPPLDPKHEAAHSCGKGHLGCVNPEHLSWKTRSENQKDRVLHGTTNRGESHPQNKLSKSDVHEIRKLIGIVPQKEIASSYGVSENAICNIKYRKSWAWLL